jgi:peptide-methionine (S)-S-oxide reductase
MRTILFTLLAVLSGQVLADGQVSPLPPPLVDTALTRAPGRQVAVFAGGCFWGVQAVFQHVRGVVSATSGYAGGAADTARYSRVSTGRTGHAESVEVVYDPSRISYGQLLQVFFADAHNPTELNRQGPDMGTQYRSWIYAVRPEQKKIAEAYIEQLSKLQIYADKIVTQVSTLPAFYPAEAYHQNFAARHPDNPYIVINDLPKIDNLKKDFPALFVPGKDSLQMEKR